MCNNRGHNGNVTYTYFLFKLFICLHVGVSWVFLYLKFHFLKCNENPGLALILCVLMFFSLNDSLKPVDASGRVSTFFSRYGLVWMPSAVGLSWLILSASRMPNTAAFANPLWPPCGPPSCPPFHVTPVTCALWQHSERTPCSGCHDNDLGGPQSAAHTHTHTSTDTLAYTLRQGRRSIFYYTEGSVGGVGGAMRVALQWAHCRDTGEIRERVSVFLSKWQKECVCVCVWGSTGDCICHWTVVPESFWVSHSVERVLNAHRMLQSDLSVESLCHTVLCIIYLIFEVCGQ